MNIKPITVKPLEDYMLFLEFSDGISGKVDLSELPGKGIFSIWKDYEKFRQVCIDPETDSISWDDGIELDSLNLYLKIIGKSFEEWKSGQLEHAAD
ncbi:MAG: DUF2442 domain-containing protein [Ignavibacteria bacterium]|nr:DUF2442 domain-containing protein [Ignavibacteria bacterium]MCC7158492.1 DUF2442 domain-containing protein [Ignavibacteria bacterium]